MINASKVKDIVQRIFSTDTNFTDCFLLEVKEIKPKKVQVFFDSDTGVNFAKCQKLSRAVEKILDEDSEVPDNYVLEISSGGVDRPLQYGRQYPKHIGRIMTIRHDDHVTEGKLVGVSDKEITLEVGNKSTGKEQITIAFERIKESIVNIRFK